MLLVLQKFLVLFHFEGGDFQISDVGTELATSDAQLVDELVLLESFAKTRGLTYRVLDILIYPGALTRSGPDLGRWDYR